MKKENIMGWGISFEAYIHRITSSQLESKLEEEEENLQFLRDIMLVLVASAPAKEESEDESDCEDHIALKFRQLWDEIIETSGRIELLNQALSAEKIVDC